MHVGLKGTMNQLFLKDLAAKTRRGLRGRVEAGVGRAAIATATTSCAGSMPDGDLEPVTGERVINASQAEIVRRVLQELPPGPIAVGDRRKR